MFTTWNRMLGMFSVVATGALVVACTAEPVSWPAPEGTSDPSPAVPSGGAGDGGRAAGDAGSPSPDARAAADAQPAPAPAPAPDASQWNGPAFTVTANFALRIGNSDAMNIVHTSMRDLPSLAIVNIETHQVAVTLTGAALDAARQEIGAAPKMTLTLPGTTPPGTYALMDATFPLPETLTRPTLKNDGNSPLQFGAGVVGFFDLSRGGGTATAGNGSDVLWSDNNPLEWAAGHVDELHSPLVLDLGCRGLTFDAPRRVFDIDGDGERDRLAWVSSEDTPFLVWDRNGNGVVDGIDEMFGNHTLDNNGQTRTSKNGFDALAQHDVWRDGVIDAHDPIFTELMLWFDKNHDGVTDAAELQPLRARGIKELSLGYLESDERGAFGNRLMQQAQATTSTGAVTIYDVWFRAY